MKKLEKNGFLKQKELENKISANTKIDLTKIKGGLSPIVIPTGNLVADNGTLTTDGRWCC